MRVQIGFVVALASCSISLWSCESTPFQARYEAGFAHTSEMSVSVFGVFKDGRMNSESWKQIGPTLSSPMGSPACEIAFDDELLAHDPEAWSAIDAYTRAEGPTDELLDRLAPSAHGDAIMLVTLSGHPPRTIGGDAGAQPQRARSSGGGGRGQRGGRRGGGMPSGSPEPETTDGSVFEISASLFSVREHRTVAALSLTYSGKSVDEALRQFTDKLRLELPRARCTGWHWTSPIDPEPIRKMTAP